MTEEDGGYGIHTLRLDWIWKYDTHGFERNVQHSTVPQTKSCNHVSPSTGRVQGWQAFSRAVVRMLLLTWFQTHASCFPTRNAHGHTFPGYIVCI